MNAVYGLLPRLLHARRWGEEALAGGGRDNRQFNDYLTDGPRATLFTAPDTVFTPRVLKVGSDSVGAMGALNRVYLNIGTFSEEWLSHFNPLIGGKPITPIPIAVARMNSAYYTATEAQTFNMAKFFLKTTAPHSLADAPGGPSFMTADQRVLTRGKEVFAENCARCHSSKLPAVASGLDPTGCAGGLPVVLEQVLGIHRDSGVQSRDARHRDGARLPGGQLPLGRVQGARHAARNQCMQPAGHQRPWGQHLGQLLLAVLQGPAIGGRHHLVSPLHRRAAHLQMPAGGRGYTRPPSLISLWSTAPFLLNNTVGRFESSPSVEARMRSFQDSIRQMLWPELRDKDSLLGAKIPGVIDRVGDRAPAGYAGEPAYVTVPAGYLPEFLQETLGAQKRLFPALFTDEGVRLGPIPQGAPIGLLANLNLL
jgi:hypothetical protein